MEFVKNKKKKKEIFVLFFVISVRETIGRDEN